MKGQKKLLQHQTDSVATKNPDSQSHLSDQASIFPTTIVGYGRYGKNYIGTKYAKNEYFWEIVSIVDPVITSSLFADSILGKNKPQTYLFQSFRQWYDNYFKHLNNQQKARQVIEIALKPELVYEQVMLYIEAGVKHFILPKPVVKNLEEMLEIAEIIHKYEIKAAVAYQWYYSDFPKFIKREIQKFIKEKKQKLSLTSSNYSSIPNLYKVEIYFSKENGLAYTTDPPLLELPHALQLLSSIGIIDFNNYLSLPEVSGTNTFVNAIYQVKNIQDKIYVRSNIDIQPNPAIKKEYPLWDIQERRLKIYFDQDNTQPNIEVDFWMKFDYSGDFALRPGKLIIRDDDNFNNQEQLILNIVDDQLLNMNLKIYAAFQQNFADFQNDQNILSLERYLPIGKQIMLIQNLWKSLQ
ncbi:MULTISPECIES: Gfo/Idh/MocA family oxidoreductase [unclassified Okeania]|uniref:Gfo/Idh/MocA family oxidoreductase n=1 Tax=unclassified Okeania TaxID=2634635 RepID=UPI0013B8D2C7|nr:MULTISPECIES: Gfo/Idh/MocA family oxidoreductase [unclassified Okeania]NES76604.1 Gfo/Idh/MocA family oxidoreductase [Okeania sp. SIO1H4]NET20203.1 Gfo/Idh/MocA family oxidoreductase [Okeania sp. SIO1H5]NET95277.1 Gfo/Idh/MocA family oxidoreductase [Okeania sp. SIO1H2]